MNQNLTFKILEPDSAHYSDAVFLAEEILLKPFGLKLSAFESKKEKTNFRVGGFLEGALCATATLTSDEDKFFLQHVAVAKNFQNKGIGSQLLKFCEEFAAENEVRVIYANARDGMGRSAVNFYVKNEYFCGEEEFFEEGIAHRIVWKILS